MELRRRRRFLDCGPVSRHRQGIGPRRSSCVLLHQLFVRWARGRRFGATGTKHWEQRVEHPKSRNVLDAGFGRVSQFRFILQYFRLHRKQRTGEAHPPWHDTMGSSLRLPVYPGEAFTEASEPAHHSSHKPVALQHGKQGRPPLAGRPSRKRSMQSGAFEEWMTHFGPHLMTELFCPSPLVGCVRRHQTKVHCKLRAIPHGFKAEGDFSGLAD